MITEIRQSGYSAFLYTIRRKVKIEAEVVDKDNLPPYKIL